MDSRSSTPTGMLEPSDLFEKYLPAKFRDRVKIEGPNQSRRSIDGEPISDADKMRGTAKQKDFGFTLGKARGQACIDEWLHQHQFFLTA